MRKIIQIQGVHESQWSNAYTTALCDDGTVWRKLHKEDYDTEWALVKEPIPQELMEPEEKENSKEITLEEICEAFSSHRDWIEGSAHGKRIGCISGYEGDRENTEDELLACIMASAATIVWKKI